ncbi:MAG TPA: hypothetical protein VFS38_06870 [Actinomycetota bacterium]|nr:hypothetical protein [Actinomycetota bacterium]
MAKPLERQDARRLRVEGMPYKKIAATLGVSVGSAYLWTSDIELTVEQRNRNLRGPGGPLNPERARRAAVTWSRRCREKRAAYQEEGRRRVRQGDSLHQAGCMLYWAEGAEGRNVVKFVNSDPQMVWFFRRFLTDALGVEIEKVMMTLNVYMMNGLTIEEIEHYWLELLELPDSAVRRHTLNHLPTSSSGKARNKLPFGVCSLVVHSTRVVQHIYGAIQEYGAFDEPAWLD